MRLAATGLESHRENKAEFFLQQFGVELRKKRLQPGDRVRVIEGMLAGRRGRYAGASDRHVKVLLQMLGIERQVQLSPDAVEQV